MLLLTWLHTSFNNAARREKKETAANSENRKCKHSVSCKLTVWSKSGIGKLQHIGAKSGLLLVFLYLYLFVKDFIYLTKRAHLLVVYGCFHTVVGELSNWDIVASKI